MNGLEGPIPGQSLTEQPGNANWEQPPLYTDVEEAFSFYEKRLSRDKVQERMFDLLEVGGVTVEELTDVLLTSGVAEGYHSIDISVLVKPTIMDFISELATTAGVEYTRHSGPTEKDMDEEWARQKFKMMLSNKGKTEAMGDKAQADLESSPTIPTPIIKPRG